MQNPSTAENNHSSDEFCIERPNKRVTLLKKGVLNTSGNKNSKLEVDKKLREQVFVNQVSFPQNQPLLGAALAQKEIISHSTSTTM